MMRNMIRYLLTRLLQMIPLLLGITFISFCVIKLSPGEPVVLGGELNPLVSAEAAERLRLYYGLNQPLHLQYIDWLKRLIFLDFGTSFSPDARPVIEKVYQHLPVTLTMNILSLIVVLLTSIPLGIASARHQNSWIDKGITVFVFIGFAAPSFWLGLLGMLYFGVHLGIVPISGLSSYGSEGWSFVERVLDYAHHLILPILIGVTGSIAGMSRYMRSSMLEVMRQDYITTAKAKGASQKTILYKHGLKNALLPVITILGLSLPGLIGGSVIFETLFSIPGMGKLFFDGVMMRDYPLIMCVLTFGAFLTLIGNLVADIAYKIVDPRIQ